MVLCVQLKLQKNDGSYNQHMHVLLCVENAYFRKENYITQTEWVDMAKAFKLSTRQNIKAIKPKKGDKDIQAAIRLQRDSVRH